MRSGIAGQALMGLCKWLALSYLEFLGPPWPLIRLPGAVGPRMELRGGGTVWGYWEGFMEC